jgi:cation-transporting ATPase E
MGQAGLTAADAGLTAAEVAHRIAAGAVNTAPARPTRSAGQILRANLLTRFNALIGGLAALVLVFGHPIDALFGWVVVFNSAIGVIQELRAKRTLDRLAVLARAPVRVRRAGREQPLPPEQVVADDLVLLGPGDKVPVDGEVRTADGLEVDESLLTGEADPVVKAPGERMLSGSFVVAGIGTFTATRVGPDAYAARLVAEASTFSLADSELYRGINQFLRYLTWIIVPVGLLLVIRQLTSDQALPDAVVSSVAGVVPMVPEGLVLMTSIAFAVAVVRLGRRRCLVQELPAVEILARVDTLCLDKTGTLTEPGMVLTEIRLAPGAPPRPEVVSALAALVSTDPSPNPTIRAIAAGVPDPPGWLVTGIAPFSSARGYSGASFAGQGTWLLGAPDLLLEAADPVRAQADQLAGKGLRLLVLARSVGGSATPGRPAGIGAGTDAGTSAGGRVPVALVVLEQKLRAAAAGTLRWFAEQEVAVKVISGDNPAAVGAIAGQLGLPGADRPVDARRLPDQPAELAGWLEQHAVFGRVTPHQKRAFVAALRSRGHTVAMTGDGVNDVLALKDADLGIAMGSGSGASRAVAKVVLLDDDFTVLPQVLGEGRRVLANIERVANLFLTKTVYSVILALLVGLAHLPFPFLPRHITLIAALTIGVPAFFLALAPSDERARGGFVPRVLRFAVPAGLACSVATFGAYLAAWTNPASDLTDDRSVATITLFLVAFLTLTLVARPLVAWKLALLAVMAGCFTLVLAVPAAREVASLTLPDPRDTVAVLTVAGLAGLGLYAGLGRSGWLPRRRARPGG